jgi:hypothetical protein
VSDPGSITQLEEAAHQRFLSASYPGTYNKEHQHDAATAVTPRVRRLAGMEA